MQKARLMPVAPHIKRLREKVGHDLLLLPTVAILPLDDRDRVLLVEQNDFGAFGTVGGAIDEDEDPKDAAAREAREEIGVEVENLELLAAIGGPQFRLTYPNGDQVQCVTIIYTARLPEAEIRPDGDEVASARWFDRDELGSERVTDFAQATFRAIGWL